MPVTREEIGSLEGFTHLGSGWFKNANDSYRIRKWIKDAIDVWHWDSDEECRDRVFRGNLYTLDELKWVLKRVCE